MSSMQRTVPVLAATLLVAVAAVAQVPRIALEPVECFPPADNGVVYASIAPEIGGTTTRLYFRWEEDEDFYYVFMHNGEVGRYWGVPARPAPKNEAVEYYVAIVDPAQQVVARSEARSSPVTDECDVELTPRQRGVAENLTVGETTFEQIGLEVDGFLCDGIVSRIDPNGILRGDELCRACVIAWWDRKAVLVPMAGAMIMTGVVIDDEEPPIATPDTPQ